MLPSILVIALIGNLTEEKQYVWRNSYILKRFPLIMLSSFLVLLKVSYYLNNGRSEEWLSSGIMHVWSFFVNLLLQSELFLPQADFGILLFFYKIFSFIVFCLVVTVLAMAFFLIMPSMIPIITSTIVVHLVDRGAEPIFRAYPIMGFAVMTVLCILGLWMMYFFQERVLNKYYDHWKQEKEKDEKKKVTTSRELKEKAKKSMKSILITIAVLVILWSVFSSFFSDIYEEIMRPFAAFITAPFREFLGQVLENKPKLPDFQEMVDNPIMEFGASYGNIVDPAKTVDENLEFFIDYGIDTDPSIFRKDLLDTTILLITALLVRGVIRLITFNANVSSVLNNSLEKRIQNEKIRHYSISVGLFLVGAVLTLLLSNMFTPALQRLMEPRYENGSASVGFLLRLVYPVYLLTHSFIAYLYMFLCNCAERFLDISTGLFWPLCSYVVWEIAGKSFEIIWSIIIHFAEEMGLIPVF